VGVNLYALSAYLPLANLQERQYERPDRRPSGHARPADHADHCAGAAARLGDCAANRADLRRTAQGATGLALSALHRLEHQGWIAAEWGASDNNRRARFYSLTRAGRKQLMTEVSKWKRLSAGVNLVLQRT